MRSVPWKDLLHLGRFDVARDLTLSLPWFAGPWLTYNMFLHLERHPFPAVPRGRLHILAERRDAVAPEWAGKKVF